MKKQTNEIMDWFNFGKVADVMSAVEWGWGPENSIPMEGDLREFARELMDEAIKHGNKENSDVVARSGGFTTSYSPESEKISLSFEVDSWTASAEKEDAGEKQLDMLDKLDTTGGSVN